MKAIIQRVASASVTVDGEVVSSIGRGLCVLVGIHRDDARPQLEHVARKVLSVRAFDDPETGRRWAKSAVDLGLEILLVSQFTLYHTMKGNKPDFRAAMGGDASKKFYSDFVEEVRRCHPDSAKVKDGVFGAMMTVDIANDGPVTLEIESPPTRKQDGGSAATAETEESKD